MQEPWKKDTNDRYSAVVRIVSGFSTAAIFLPILLVREFLGVPPETSLREIFGISIYLSLLSFSLAVVSSVFYQYLLAKWIRIAWGQNAGIFWSEDTKEERLERFMEISFWATFLFFGFGVALQLCFFFTYSSS